MADDLDNSIHNGAHEATLAPNHAPLQDAQETVNQGTKSQASNGKHSLEREYQNEKIDSSEGDLPPRKKTRRTRSVTGTSESKASQSGDDEDVDAEASGEDTKTPTSQSLNLHLPAATGLRTSFAKKGQVTEQNVHLEMHNSLTAAEAEQLRAAVKASNGVNLGQFSRHGTEWTLCPLQIEWLDGKTWFDIFKSLVSNWCVQFQEANKDNASTVGIRPVLLRDGFMQSIDKRLPMTLQYIARKELTDPEKHMGKFRKAKDPAKDPKGKAREEARAEEKAAKKKAKAEAKKEQRKKQRQADQQSPQLQLENEGGDSGASTSVSTSVSVSPPVPASTSEPSGTNGEANAFGPALIGLHVQIPGLQTDDMSTAGKAPLAPVSAAELEQRRRYYPSISDTAIFCLTCAQYDDHPTSSCPETTCIFCRGAHFKYQCPTRSRCAKCKQIGHQSQACAEKLAVAPGEVASECAFCQAHDHTERNCNELWQSYRPRSGQTRKVRSLPVYCYCCGAEGHFGGDCGLANGRIPPTKTWTTSTASLYIDPSSADDALALKNPLPMPQGVPRPNIPGRSIKPRTHVVFEESDDDNTHNGSAGFISRPVAGGSVAPGSRRQATGQGGGASAPKIQISSNINFAGTSREQRQQEMQQPFGVDLPGTKKSRGNNRRKGAGKANNGAKPPLPPGPPPQQRQHNGARGGGGGGGGGRPRSGGGFSSLKNKRNGRGNR